MTTTEPRPTGTRTREPDRNLAVELIRATEAAAMASARYLGRGDKNQVDAAAVDAMRPVLGTVAMRGVVVIGEGEKDDAPMLYNGEQVGDGTGPEVDIAVDPVDGTTLAAKVLPDAISVVALAERGKMFDPGPCFYMRKTVVPPAAAGRRRSGGPGRRHDRQGGKGAGPPGRRPDGRRARPAAAHPPGRSRSGPPAR